MGRAMLPTFTLAACAVVLVLRLVLHELAAFAAL